MANNLLIGPIDICSADRIPSAHFPNLDFGDDDDDESARAAPPPSSGPLLHTGLYLHELCCIWSPSCFTDQHSLIGVAGELRRSARAKCLLCGLNGATLGCHDKRCRRQFHLSCAVQSELNFEFRQKGFAVFCDLHRRQKRTFKSPALGLTNAAPTVLDSSPPPSHCKSSSSSQAISSPIHANVGTMPLSAHRAGSDRKRKASAGATSTATLTVTSLIRIEPQIEPTNISSALAKADDILPPTVSAPEPSAPVVSSDLSREIALHFCLPSAHRWASSFTSTDEVLAMESASSAFVHKAPSTMHRPMSCAHTASAIQSEEPKQCVSNSAASASHSAPPTLATLRARHLAIFRPMLLDNATPPISTWLQPPFFSVELPSPASSTLVAAADQRIAYDDPDAPIDPTARENMERWARMLPAARFRVHTNVYPLLRSLQNDSDASMPL
jgi:hypothetical protein